MPPRFGLLFAALTAGACSFVLDFDELQSGGTGGRAATGGSESGGVAPLGGNDGTGGNTPGEAGQGGAQEPRVPISEAPAELAAALCQKIEACVGGAAMAILYGDEDCLVSAEKLIANTIVAAVERSAEESDIAYDDRELPGCLEAYQALACEDTTLGFPEECKSALSGLHEEGGSCAHALECGEGLYCAFEDCSCSQPAATGEACVVSSQCEPGLTCFDSQCVPLAREGEPCEGTVAPECVTGMICVTADEKAAMAGRCFPAEDLFVGSAGQTCNAVGDPPTLCREGLSCPVGLLPTCQRPAPSGGVCTLAFPDMCPEDEYCSGGVCTKVPGPGEPCANGILLKRACTAYSRCVSGTCRLLGNNGNTCVSPEECWSGICTDGICAPPHCQ